MKTKRRTVPGSIYADRGRLYIRFKGQRYATGLLDNKFGRSCAEDILMRKFEEYHSIGAVPVVPITIQDAFSEFLKYKMNRAPKTQRQYGLAKNAILSTTMLSNYNIERDIQHYIRTTKHNNVTINNYLTHLQIFLNYCADKKWIPATRFKKDYKVFINDPEPKTWTEDEITLLLEYFDKIRPDISRLIRFQLATGARLVDALTLRPEDIKDNVIYFKNKITKRAEPRPLSQEALRLINETPVKYIDRIFPWTHASTSRLHKALVAACKVLDIERNERSFQEFRVTFRMRLLKAGTPSEYVRWLMRHKTMNITDNFYTEFNALEIRQYLEKIA